MKAEVAARGDGLEAPLVKMDLPEEKLEKHRSFVPPVPEELGVVGRHNDRLAPHPGAQMLDLTLAVVHEVAGVLGCAKVGDAGIVGPLVVKFPVGDREVL